MISSMYKNKKSLVIENDNIRAEFIPDPGGKMVSLISKKTGYEFLVQRAGEHYRDQPFDGSYVDGECSGYDDMFPTIDVCTYESEPWKGVKMADHGEVWSLPWEYKVEGEALSFYVKGVRFPFELKKCAAFHADNTLRLNYTLTNLSPFNFEFLWAGHFMLNVEVGTRLAVPEDCTQAVSILTNTDFRKFGDIVEWPYLRGRDGTMYRADIMRPPETKGFEKFYFKNRLNAGWCELQYPDNKKRLKVSFPVETVPYLGVLINEKGWDDLYNIFIEPCTVCYDRPDVAKQHGQVSKIGPNAKYEWYIDLTIL